MRACVRAYVHACVRALQYLPIISVHFCTVYDLCLCRFLVDFCFIDLPIKP